MALEGNGVAEMEIQEELHIKIQSENENERIKALEMLRHYTYDDLQFIYLPLFDMDELGEDLHKVSTDNSSDVKKFAAITIKYYFFYIHNQDQLWTDLVRLASDENSNVRNNAIIAIDSIYSIVKNKDRVWSDLVVLSRSNYANVREVTTKILVSVFPQVSSKDEAWKDLGKLALEDDYETKQVAAKVIGSVFPYIPEKNEAWERLRNLTIDEDVNVIRSAVNAFQFVFPYSPNKTETWKELHCLVYNDDNEVRQITAKVIGSVFQHIPEKKEALEDLHKLTLDDDVNVKRSAAAALGSIFPYASEQEKIWTDLMKLISYNDTIVESNAKHSFESTLDYLVEKEGLFKNSQQNLYGENDDENECNGSSLTTVLLDVLNKEDSWNNLTSIIHHKSSESWKTAMKVITYIFPVITNKMQTWNDLYKCVQIGKEVNYLLSVFAYVPDKEKALEDLVKLNSEMETERKWGSLIVSTIEEFINKLDKEQVYKSLQKLLLSENTYVKKTTISVLVSLFPSLPDKDHLNSFCDKEQAWEDLLALTSEREEVLKRHAATALGLVFLHVPNKSRAWKDLHKLISNMHFNVRRGIASSIGSAFPYVPNKTQAWEDLVQLTSDEKNYVRVSAYHSMGRISIFKASQSESEDEYRTEVEKAIDFFDKASKELTYHPPSKFCLPFYRSFYAIVFEKYETEEEVEKYLQEAKAEIEESKNKKVLFEVIKYLSIFLKEFQNIESIDLEAKKKKLSLCRKYCEQAAELMNETEITAPFATATIKKGFPILNRKLEGLLEEIQEKAKTACRESQGTDTKEIACAVSREVQKWEISSQEEMTEHVKTLIFSLESVIPNNENNKKIYEKIEAIGNEKDLIKQYEILSLIIALIPKAQVETQSRTRAIESSATIAGFAGFAILEIVNSVHPLVSSNDHFICFSVAVLIFLIVFVFTNNK
ncbi:HEAT repeat domain-containing protein [Methanosarcina mazei]|uniref:HEAT repeat domain-containing protein n=2 Tax=Methanosarcina mazei TaxID=2209 RepID=A0A6C0VI42_METMZ|nr:HEAT repeat domain-containing protein [Methanosarcina mazei]QIB90825.1 HEAT repeat domain-containing protein [Methanosarcina mazei]WIM43311.1 HEAT repeat domain-containing protein [Methanosarcina mazei]